MFLYKVDTKKEKLDDFKTAISSTVRSISNSQKLEVSFGNQTSNSDKDLIFHNHLEFSLWKKCLEDMGIDPSKLVSYSGSA